jgi:hypothetical protein
MVYLSIPHSETTICTCREQISLIKHTFSYHANNEYCTVSGMRNGYKILLKIIDKLAH